MEQVLKLRSDPTELRLMRAFVSRWADRTGLGEEVRYEACLVATEAVTNAIRHADADEEITVICSIESGELVIEVQDRGTWRSGPKPLPPVIEDPAPEDLGGRGLFIIQELTRSFRLEKRRDGSTLSMRLGAADGGCGAAEPAVAA